MIWPMQIEQSSLLPEITIHNFDLNIGALIIKNVL